MPTYDHVCKSCGHEWEDIYSMRDDVPDICPKCNVKGQVKRLISGVAKVNVELTGRDLVNKLRAEGKELARLAKKSDSVAADLYGLK
ncbi:MAG: zinc ribbon domain-containing protein [Clostridia bacterium]